MQKRVSVLDYVPKRWIGIESDLTFPDKTDVLHAMSAYYVDEQLLCMSTGCDLP